MFPWETLALPNALEAHHRLLSTGPGGRGWNHDGSCREGANQASGWKVSLTYTQNLKVRSSCCLRINLLTVSPTANPTNSLPHEVWKSYGNHFRWGNWVWETKEGYRGNCLESGLKSRMPDLSPLIPKPSFVNFDWWVEIFSFFFFSFSFLEKQLLATRKEAKWTKNIYFFNISTKGSLKEAALCSFIKCSVSWRQQLSQKKRAHPRDRKTGSSSCLSASIPKVITLQRVSRSSGALYFCRGVINPHQSCIRTSNI